MAGPYPPEYGAGPVGPQMYPGHPPQPFAPQPFSEPYPENVPSAYPGMLPPPVHYPKKRRWPLVAGALAAVVVVAALVAAIVLVTRGGDASVEHTDRRVGEGGDSGVLQCDDRR